jgi:hypothetical protein
MQHRYLILDTNLVIKTPYLRESPEKWQKGIRNC